MGIKQLYNDNLPKLPNEYEDVSVMEMIFCCEVQWMQSLKNADVRVLGGAAFSLNFP